MIYIGLVGLFFGSFFGVVAERVPQRRSIVRPPSSCPHCGHRLGVKDLIPVVSFAFQRARCRYCKTRISYRYPLVELASGAVFLLAYYVANGSWELFFTGAVFMSFLLILFLIDLDAMVLPNVITWPGIAVGMLLSAAGLGFVGLVPSILGAAVGYGILGLVRVASKGAMGGGDIKMLAMIGAFLGPERVLYTLFAASLFGSVVGGTLLLFGRHKKGMPIPFGPFLSAGAVAVLCYVRWFTQT